MRETEVSAASIPPDPGGESASSDSREPADPGSADESPTLSPHAVGDVATQGDPDAENSLLALGPWLDGAPAWLTSAVLHLLLLVLFALLAIGADEEARLSLSAVFSEDLGEQLIEESLDLSAELEIEVDEQALTPDTLPPVPDPLATPMLADITPEAASFATNIMSPTPGAALSGRMPGRREALLKAFGGTEETEAAVLEGLKWLARQQQRDGGWSLKGPYPDGSARENREAATGMALLAFQGAGHLPNGDGQFSKNVRRGWNWLLPQQHDTGSFFHSGAYNHRYYTHAIGTIALCELFGMTRADSYQQPAQAAVDFLVKTQSEEGGWKYNPKMDSDLSVTGWVLMALKSARMAGLEVPTDVFLRIEEFLDTVSRVKGSRYVYEPQLVFNPESIPSMTAEGLLCRQYLGWPRDHLGLRQGVEFLLEFPPEWREPRRDVYYWYYATQVFRHMGGPTWETWNRQMRVVLPANQVLRGGRRVEGSWDPDGDRWGAYGGRLYQTCLSIYILEVYYRHLPIYQQRAIADAR